MSQRKSVALVAIEAVENVTQYLRVPRLQSIRSRILALAVIGTIIPAGISLGVAYTQNRRAREEKITQELLSESSQTARAMGVWLKERIYDLRVFASSDEVSNNLNRFASSSIVGGRLREYLRSLHERFSDFDQLIVLDPEGRVLASSAEGRAVRLPADWQKMLRQQNQLVGEAYWDSASTKGKLILAVPVQRADGRLLGAFAAELNLTPVQAQLRSFAPDSNGIVYLLSGDSALIASSAEVSPELLKTRLKPGAVQRLTTHQGEAVTYASVGNREVVGTLTRVPQLPWSVVSEVSAETAFHQVRQFRNAALLVVFLLLVVVGATAYWLGIIIVRPLERLAEGAAEVSSGDLHVDLPETGGGGEVGALTTVFNFMVRRLREHRQELERLSVTDGLTGLANHRSLMQRLKEEATRSARSKRSFSVIMADVDHFKMYNDSFGHPAGDVVLKRVGALLKDSTRTIDCVGRYGGEEFAAILPETEMVGALEVAERIRTRIEAEQFPERAITLSIGVAEFPKDADRPEQIIAVADKALYEAKRGGRNRVMEAGEKAQKEMLPSAKRPSRATKKKG